MEAAPDNYEVADFSAKETKDAFSYAGAVLETWAKSVKVDTSKVRGLHPKLNHRTMEVWGPLIAVCIEADGGEPGEWTDRILLAFERIELNGGTPVYAPQDQILVDYLDFMEAAHEETGVPSGAFAQYATTQPHGAYTGMKPGQFKQFAVKHLGPTAPYYDAEKGTTVRGWSDMVHKLNMDRATVRKEELEASKDDGDGEAYEWEDF
jgi:hypothetical protein